jgi:hypothetical protein
MLAGFGADRKQVVTVSKCQGLTAQNAHNSQSRRGRLATNAFPLTSHHGAILDPRPLERSTSSAGGVAISLKALKASVGHGDPCPVLTPFSVQRC